MRVKTLSRNLAIAVSLGAVLLGVTAYSAVIEACGAGYSARPELSGGRAAATMRSLAVEPPAQVSDAVMEWNQQAATRTLSASPALAPPIHRRVRSRR